MDQERHGRRGDLTDPCRLLSRAPSGPRRSRGRPIRSGAAGPSPTGPGCRTTLMAPKSVEPMSWGWSASPGTDHGPLCTSGTVITEHTVDWRWARSVRCKGCRPGDQRTTRRSATSRYRPRSLAAGRRRNGPPRRARRRPCAGVTVSGTVVPLSPCSQRRRGRALRARVRRRIGPAARLPDRARSARRGRSRCGPRRSGTGRRSRAGRSGSPFPPIWGSVAAVSCWAANGNPVERPGAHRRPGRAVPVHPTPANSVAAPAVARCSRCARPASMVDCPAPVSRMKGYGPRSADAHVDRLGDLAGDHADGQRHLLPAVRAVRWLPLQPVAAGGRANVTCGSTCTAAAFVRRAR